MSTVTPYYTVSPTNCFACECVVFVTSVLCHKSFAHLVLFVTFLSLHPLRFFGKAKKGKYSPKMSLAKPNPLAEARAASLKGVSAGEGQENGHVKEIPFVNHLQREYTFRCCKCCCTVGQHQTTYVRWTFYHYLRS